MPLMTQQWAGGAGPALPANLMVANAGAQISNAIGMITAANMFGAVGGIPALQNIFNWRVDRQNAPGGFVNISVQRNGVPAPSTVASVFVPGTYTIGRSGPPARAGGAQRSTRPVAGELERAVRHGLEQSFATYGLPLGAPPMMAGQPNNNRSISRFEVTGTFSS